MNTPKIQDTDRIRQVVAKASGGPEQLVVEPMTEILRPGPGEILVQVQAAGINFLDIMHRKGMSSPPFPFTPGLEGVGLVKQLGEGTSPAFAVGQRVAWINARGSYASELVLPATQAIIIPDDLAAHQALLFQAITAHYLAYEYRNIQPGDRVLVHAVAGGVGQILVQLLKHQGAWVVGTSSSQAKAAIAQEIGADAVINYGHDYNFLEKLLSLTAGRGVDLAFDSVGAATLASTMKGLARGGMAVVYGSSSGPPPVINPLDLIGPCTRLAAGSLFSYIAEPGELQRRASDLLAGIRAGWLRMPEGTAYDLELAAQAHRDMESRKAYGKLYLTP